MSSELPLTADIDRYSRHVSNVPITVLMQRRRLLLPRIAGDRRGCARPKAPFSRVAFSAGPRQAAGRSRTRALGRANQNAPHP
jgi:hypothetical protein